MEMARFTRRYPQLLDPLLKEFLALVAVSRGSARLLQEGVEGALGAVGWAAQAACPGCCAVQEWELELGA